MVLHLGSHVIWTASNECLDSQHKITIDSALDTSKLTTKTKDFIDDVSKEETQKYLEETYHVVGAD